MPMHFHIYMYNLFFFEIKEWITTILSQCFFLLFSWIPTFVLYVGTELELPPDV